MKLLDKFIAERTILEQEDHSTADASKLNSFVQQQDSDEETAALKATGMNWQGLLSLRCVVLFSFCMLFMCAAGPW